jgi:hypothetical protein
MTASFTVFVCSTFSDLSQERDGVLKMVRQNSNAGMAP